MTSAIRIQINGIVQGVGFRPFVYRIARRNLINGWVLNAEDGVHIHAEGEDEMLASFLQDLRWDAPAAARIDSLVTREVPSEGFAGFEIRHSERAGAATTLISPDIATCPDCLRELFSPDDRRFRYPFINCTNCGPRFTIINDLPYDRPSTSMAHFEMCPDCAGEYADPADRRFHAQPDACFECGPELSFWRGGAEVARADGACTEDARRASDAILREAGELLRDGGILAIKGLGGYHLACNACDEAAVLRLRERKHRYGKPLAVMMHSVDEACAYCRMNETEAALLEGSVRPIVLLERLGSNESVAALPLAEAVTKSPLEVDAEVALHEIGVMLPPTPLHHLIMAEVPFPLVMTSGNISEEPILTANETAHVHLGTVADAFIDHNRDIVSRYDDSVVRVVNGRPVFVRRARGYAPMPIALPGRGAADSANTAPLLACGPEQKATFCLTRDNEAFVSQHIGDLENAETFASWRETLVLYMKMFEVSPTLLACDLHPEYLASKWARAAATDGDAPLPLVEAQHHHAHIASVIAENAAANSDAASTCAFDEHVIGIALDGTGYGTDGAIWGGEVLIASCADFTRFAHLAYAPMPGGAAAVLNPGRMAIGYLAANDLVAHPGATPLKKRLGPSSVTIMQQMIERGINCPLTSSTGRLFDAVSALCGLGDTALYDGSGACLLEAALWNPETGDEIEDVEADDAATRYRFTLSTCDDDALIISQRAVLTAVLDDLVAGVPTPIVARRFHDALIRALVEVAEAARAATGLTKVALSGGCFMNRYLLTFAPRALEAAGFTVLLNRELPANDGCIAYGQAAIARTRS